MMEALKRAMKGRSGTVERGVDTALSHLERYSATLKQRAETVKERARTLDPDRTGPTGDPAPPAPDRLADPAAAPPARPADPAPPAPPASGPSLRGDLVGERPDEGPGAGAGQPG